MDIEKFLDPDEFRPSWAFEPCLYIVKQTNAGHNAHRCGASGTHMYAGSDLPYGADRASNLTGLLGRMVMYKNYWLPLKGTIYAALRVKKQLVADSTQRTGQDAEGNAFNIDRGNYTLVLHREKEFHAELDRRKLRWRDDRNNELFLPKRGVEELISAMRMVHGEQMYIFKPDLIVEDPAYRGGTRRELITITETKPRAMPGRVARTPSITVRLSKASIDQLRAANPNHFEQLLNIFREYVQDEKAKTKTTSTVTVQMEPDDIQDLRDQTTRGNAIAKGIRQMMRATNEDDSTETTVSMPTSPVVQVRRSARFLPQPQPLRRSGRLAQKKN